MRAVATLPLASSEAENCFLFTGNGVAVIITLRANCAVGLRYFSLPRIFLFGSLHTEIAILFFAQTLSANDQREREREKKNALVGLKPFLGRRVPSRYKSVLYTESRSKYTASLQENECLHTKTDGYVLGIKAKLTRQLRVNDRSPTGE